MQVADAVEDAGRFMYDSVSDIDMVAFCLSEKI